MMSFTGFAIYYWFAYAWLVVGVLLIGIPAVKQIYNIMKKE